MPKIIKHICILTETGLKMLKQGRNIFDCSPNEALIALTKAKAEGKKYYTGCDNENLEGRCAGHKN